MAVVLALQSLTKFFGYPACGSAAASGAGRPSPGCLAIQPPWHVNAIAQAAAGIAFEAGEYARRTISLVQQERRFLASSLAELHLVKQVYPSAANFLLLELRPPATAPDVWEQLARQGVLVRDCSNFGWLGDRFIRVAVRDHDKNLLLLERLKQLDENTLIYKAKMT